jgi:hypothetical protein
MGAGVKDSNNNFTGVVMGAVKQNSSNTTTYNGLLGFSQGIISIYLDAETGNATFGRPGEGQIKLVPGGTSSIAGWKINTDSFSSNDNKSILYANESHKEGDKSLRFNINNLFKVYSDGSIKSTAGTIGGWTIETNSLHTNNKNTFGSNNAGAFLGADGKFDFTSSSRNYLRYNGDSFAINIGRNNFFNVTKDEINLGDFVISDGYGRNIFSNSNGSMAISANLNYSGEWWMWFSADGENDSDDPEDYDFVLNGGGQVYAKEFICTNSSHPYNICIEIERLWNAIENIDTECHGCNDMGKECDDECHCDGHCDGDCDKECYGPGW